MGATEQLLPTIGALVALGEFAQEAALSDADEKVAIGSEDISTAAREARAEREWQGAIAAAAHLLTQSIDGGLKQPSAAASKKSSRKSSKQSRQSARAPHALVLSGPVPVLNDPALLSQISNWTFVPAGGADGAPPFEALSPVERFFKRSRAKKAKTTRLLPLLENDPLVQEQFALVLTSQFSLVLVLGPDADGILNFQYSFMPEVVGSIWRLLRSRIVMSKPKQLDFIESLVSQFEPQEPHYRLVSQFNRWLLACMPQPRPQPSGMVTEVEGQQPTQSGLTDSDFLKAMAHEINTPLTTIRTYTRGLLKRPSLDAQVIKRLQSIDRECTQQIDRFNLIFRAVELEAASQSLKSPLSAIALQDIFNVAIPQWQSAAQRRNLSLDVGLPPDLPMVASDPTMLQHVLTGLVELFTHSVPSGSHIELHVRHAGDQLKLQFEADGESDASGEQAMCAPPELQSLGHLLMFQPETGGLSLNLAATKNLFSALGAKLTVRDRGNQRSTWTVYLPLETSGLQSYPIV